MKIRDILESATAGATSAANIGTVVSPHIAIGKDRGKKSYTGSPGKSGTKAPAVPKVKQAKNKDFISGYSVMEFFSIVSAFSFLMPIIINYINYINWYKTLPAYLIFKPLITPSKGIEPFLIVFLGLALLAAWLGTSKYKFSDPKHQKLQRIKTFIISGLLLLTGLLYLLIGLANVLNFVGLPFYAPVQHPEGSAYLIVCGLISIATALMPSKLLFGKNLITELKSKNQIFKIPL